VKLPGATFLRRLNIDGFMLAIFAAVAVGSVFPATGSGETVVLWAVRVSIFLLFFLYGARLSPREAFEGLKHWRLHLTVLCTTFVAFPLLGLALGLLEPTVIAPELYVGVLFLCLVPSTVQSSIAFTSIAHGNVAGAIVSASASNLLGVFLTPLLAIWLLSSTGNATIDPSSILDIGLQILLPFVLGQCARPLLGSFLSRHAKRTKLVDRTSIVLVVYSAFAEGMREGIWQTVSAWSVLLLVGISVVILAVMLAATHYGGKALGFNREDRIVIVFAGSKKSLASGLPMAAVLFTGPTAALAVLPLMIFHQLQLIACASIAARLGKQYEQP
jgi:sodium/bile acid cotransporter 7